MTLGAHGRSADMFLALVLAAAPADAGYRFITAEALKGDIAFLASDLTEGRLPGTYGDLVAENYIVAQFQIAGLKPGARTSRGPGYSQEFMMASVDGSPKRVTFRFGSQSLVLEDDAEIIAVAGRQRATSSVVDAEVVFVGYGIDAPQYQWNDFKGMDVRGKVLLVMNNDPETDPTLFAGKTRLYYGRWDYKYEQALKLGAAGCIIIHTTPSAGYPWSVVQSSWRGAQLALFPGAETAVPNDAPGLEMRSWITEESARKLVALGANNLDTLRSQAQRRNFKPVPLGVRVTAEWANKLESIRTANILGVLPGNDPLLRDEFVVVSAHHDHLGKVEGPDPLADNIYNGAVDNASGVAAMLAIARELAANPPKRSIMFAALAAEEQGLLGSEWLVRHFPVPLRKIAANINIDGLNFFGRTTDLEIVGKAKSSVDNYITAAAKAQGRRVVAEAMPDRGSFYRSDQFNFAKVGIPAGYFHSGIDFIGRPPGWGIAQREAWEANVYHKPADEVSADWNYAGALEDVEATLQVVRAIANAPTGPTWTKGDEFEAVRISQRDQEK